MADKHIVFDVLSFGLYVVFISFAGLYLFDAYYFDCYYHKLTDIINKTFNANGKGVDVSSLLSWLLIIGSLASFLGIMVRLLSITIFQNHHFHDKYRKILKEKILEYIKPDYDLGICKCDYKKMPADPFFAFIHWQKGENLIVEWGRYKNRYAYMAENYIIGTYIGMCIIGPTLGLFVTDKYVSKCTYDQLLPSWFACLIAYVLSLVFGEWRACKELKKNNEWADGSWRFYLTVFIFIVLPFGGLCYSAYLHSNHDKIDWGLAIGIVWFILLFYIALWTVWIYNRKAESAMIAVYVASVISNGTVEKMFTKPEDLKSSLSQICNSINKQSKSSP